MTNMSSALKSNTIVAQLVINREQKKNEKEGRDRRKRGHFASQLTEHIDVL